MDIVFIVLHYIVEEETKSCVQRLQEKIDTDDYHIIVVDNASPNGSGASLNLHYKDSEHVTVILNQENLGFAKGNNVGFRYAKEKWNPRYIVMLNNDVYLLEDQLILKLDQEYAKSNFAVLGPMIMTADGRCDCNPSRENAIAREQMQQLRNLTKKKLFFWKWNLTPLIENLIFIRNVISKKRTVQRHKPYLERLENAELHGCFLVFSSTFIQEFDGLDDRTFLYHEEEILYVHVVNHGMKLVYLPDITVFHKEDVATDAIVGKKNKEKHMFQLRNELHSLDVLMNVYDSYASK